MSEAAPVGQSKARRLAIGAEGFDTLAELALDMRSSWNHATNLVWRQLDPVLWDITHNPWVVTSGHPQARSGIAEVRNRKWSVPQ